MELVSVKSGNIAAVGYDAATKKLQVQFSNGALYEYYDVPESFYKEFMNSESKGKFFATHKASGTLSNYRKL